MRLSLLDVYSFKFEALLAVISVFVVVIDDLSLNIKKIVNNLCPIITIYNRNFAK